MAEEERQSETSILIDDDVESSILADRPPISEEWLPVAGISTCVLKYGTLEESKPLALIMPGNPGVPHFYEEFMWVFHYLSNYQIPIWVVGHAGHTIIPQDIKPIYPKENVYSLGGQVKHKQRFIEDHVPSDKSLILIGHSIGAHIVLKMVALLPPERVLQGILLFPTIERLSSSPQGRLVMPWVRYCYWLTGVLVYPLGFIPSPIQRCITRVYYNFLNKGKRTPNCTIEASLRFISPECVLNILYMGKTEMEGVSGEADHDIIRANNHRLMLYYGSHDHWCPQEYFDDMKRVHPQLDIRQCEEHFEHAFILRGYSGVRMAQIVYDWLNQRLIGQI